MISHALAQAARARLEELESRLARLQLLDDQIKRLKTSDPSRCGGFLSRAVVFLCVETMPESAGQADSSLRYTGSFQVLFLDAFCVWWCSSLVLTQFLGVGGSRMMWLIGATVEDQGLS